MLFSRLLFYRMFHLKRYPNDYTWTLSRTKRWNQWQYWIFAAVSRCCSWRTAWNRYGRNFSCFVARWALVTGKHLLCPEMLLPVGVLFLIRYILVRIRIAKCFTNSSKRFRCEVMFENEHAFCLCSHLFSVCATGVSIGLATRATLPECHGGGWVNILHGGGPASDFIFVPQCVIVVGLRFMMQSVLSKWPSSIVFVSKFCIGIQLFSDPFCIFQFDHGVKYELYSIDSNPN
jgi:hypothetical protein